MNSCDNYLWKYNTPPLEELIYNLKTKPISKDELSIDLVEAFEESESERTNEVSKRKFDSIQNFEAAKLDSSQSLETKKRKTKESTENINWTKEINKKIKDLYTNLSENEKTSILTKKFFATLTFDQAKEIEGLENLTIVKYTARLGLRPLKIFFENIIKKNIQSNKTKIN